MPKNFLKWLISVKKDTKKKQDYQKDLKKKKFKKNTILYSTIK